MQASRQQDNYLLAYWANLSLRATRPKGRPHSYIYIYIYPRSVSSEWTWAIPSPRLSQSRLLVIFMETRLLAKSLLQVSTSALYDSALQCGKILAFGFKVWGGQSGQIMGWS